MKTAVKKLLCLLLAAVMLIPLAGLIPFTAEAGGPYKVGETFKFGGYPQTKVEDNTLIEALNNEVKSTDWVSYRYTTGDGKPGSETEGDWMKYCDIEYNGEKFRGVQFAQHRPGYTNTNSSGAQHSNGYGRVNFTYWFKWESLVWRVMDPDTGLVVCDSLIDSQPFLIDTGVGNTGNTYDQSSIRAWLNDDFISTAFSQTELNKIGESKLTSLTYDKIFLLSKNEINNPAYGLSEVPSARPTDYAQVQGIGGKDITFLSDSVFWFVRYSCWWTRTPGEEPGEAATVGTVINPDTKDWYFEYDVSETSIGVRPAFRFKDFVEESINPVGHEHSWGEWQQESLNRQQHVRVCKYNPNHKDYQEHTWSEYNYSYRPNCSSMGVGVHYCTVCNFEAWETVPADPDNHAPVYKDITPATCKTEGERKITCSRCHKDLGTETTPVNPNAHVWDEGVEITGSKPQIKYTCTLCGATKTISSFKQGDTLQFGAYPQSKVTNNSTISALNGKAASAAWYSYGYYSGMNDTYGSMSSGDFMKYCDVEYNGIKYRGVKMTAYRPNKTTKAATAENSGIDELEYELNTTYWFKWEPLTWRVLGRPDTGTRASLIICDQIIDAQAYTNTIYKDPDGSSYSGYYFADSAFKNYAADYSVSSIRHWLINDFYNTAFTTAEREMIRFTDVQSDFYAGDGVGSTHVNTNNLDKVYLLSKEEARLSYLFANNSSRIAKGTDYAMMQGGLEVLPNSGGSTWALRGGNSGSSYMVWGNGEVNQEYAQIVKGVRPVLNFVDDIIVPSPGSAGGNGVYAQDAELTHCWDKGVEIKPATCGAEGEKVYTCVICGESKSEPIPTVNHNWGSWTKSDDKQHKRVCKTDETHVQYQDHTWNAGEVTANPTCTKEGETTYTCTVCKAKKTEPIAMLPHEWLNWVKFDDEMHMRACALDRFENHSEYEPHTWDKGTVITPATTATEGQMKYHCSVCGGDKTEPIPLLPSSITVEGGTPSVASAAKGATVTITATAPPSGKTFDKWEVVKGGVTLENASAATTTFVMGSTVVQIRATYKDLAAGEHSVTVIGGTANVSSAKKGTTVVITAPAEPEGKVFQKWEVVKGDVTLADASKPRTTFVMGDADVEVKAVYKDISQPPVTGVMLGDVDNNGEINSADARKALRRAVDLETYAEGSREFIACDVDKNGTVTSADARKILRAAVELEDPATW